ncbi:MAG: hypothetical protein HYZ40_09415 [Rhodospirillales bacterium]|nr:hypothetical protein [Rhodospirillales bacterium]
MQRFATQRSYDASTAAVGAAAAVLLLAALVLVATVATSPPSFVYDEPDYVNYVFLLRRYGLTEEFLEALTGGAGPLYAFVHRALEPLTNLSPVKMRLVNVALLAVVAGILAGWLKRQDRPDYLLAGCTILVVPMTWVLAGMALTSMPALVFVSLSLYALLRGAEALERESQVLGWFVAGGIFLGIAVWGRQTALVLSGVPLLLALMDRRLRLPALVFVAIIVAFTAPLVIAWEGFTPPNEEADEGLSLRHGLTSLGYTGFCFFLLVPRAKWLSWKSLVAAAVMIAIVNALLGIVVLCPIESFMDDFLSDFGMAACAVLFGSVLVFCAVMFLGWILRITWHGRRDLKQVTINAGLLCLALSPALIANYYSSRYTAMALPYLVLAAQPWRTWGWKMSGAAVAGCAAGLLSLLGYFWAT